MQNVPNELTASSIVFHDSPLASVDDRARIHAWILDVDDESQSGALDESVLSDSELQESGALKTPQLRRRSIACRVLTRQILATCLGVAPESIEFERNAWGKPRVALPAPLVSPGAASPALYFNISHSENLLLVGVSFGAEIGVDIELIGTGRGPALDFHGLAESHFSADERAQLFALTIDQQQAAFFRCWTLKEAALKSLGLGISAGLDAVELDLDQSGTPRIVCIKDHPAPLNAWSWLQPTRSHGVASAAICPRTI